jgi:bifunctional oligoribonuclease and PAP phosphatase NrnA
MHKEFASLIAKSSKIAIVSHLNPDADALGTSLGILHALKLTGKSVCAVNMSGLPRALDFLPGYDDIGSVLDDDIDLVISVDCGSFARLGIVRGAYTLMNIDHHHSNDRYGDINIVETTYPSCASVAYELLRSCGFVVPKESAECFYTALVSDTGFFKFENVTGETFEEARELVMLGACPSHTATQLTQRKRMSELKLKAKILGTLELFCENRVAFLFVTLDAFTTCGASSDEADGAAESARAIDGVEVSLFMREEKNSIRCSLRSKYSFDCSEVSALFGGGGHKRAAGFSIELKAGEDFASALAKASASVVDEIKKRL